MEGELPTTFETLGQVKMNHISNEGMKSCELKRNLLAYLTSLLSMPIPKAIVATTSP
jgi:hypothetical protein